MSKYSIFFTISLLLIIFFISYWLNSEVKKELEIKQKKITNNPDFFLKNFSSKQTNQNGELNFSLNGIQMNFFSFSDESNLKKPKFKKFENQKNILGIKSDKGIIFDNGEKIKMLDNVELVRNETKTKKQMKLLSNEVVILPNNEFVTSEKRIKIIQEPNIEVDGIGLQYNKKEGIIKILKEVRVQYAK